MASMDLSDYVDALRRFAHHSGGRRRRAGPRDRPAAGRHHGAGRPADRHRRAVGHGGRGDRRARRRPRRHPGARPGPRGGRRPRPARPGGTGARRVPRRGRPTTTARWPASACGCPTRSRRAPSGPPPPKASRSTPGWSRAVAAALRENRHSPVPRPRAAPLLRLRPQLNHALRGTAAVRRPAPLPLRPRRTPWTSARTASPCPRTGPPASRSATRPARWPSRPARAPTELLVEITPLDSAAEAARRPDRPVLHARPAARRRPRTPAAAHARRSRSACSPPAGRRRPGGGRLGRHHPARPVRRRVELTSASGDIAGRSARRLRAAHGQRRRAASAPSPVRPPLASASGDLRWARPRRG